MSTDTQIRFYLYCLTACQLFGSTLVGQCNFPSTLPVGFSPKQAAIGDLNADGFPDLMMSASNTPSLATYLNNGEGSLILTHQIFGAGARFIELADWDLDGDLDAFVLFTDFFAVFANDGAGIFSVVQEIDTNSEMSHFQCGDFNNDGIPDVIGVKLFSNFTEQLSIYLSDGQGDYSAGPPTIVDSGPIITVGDYDLDGNMDVATASVFGLHIRFGFGNGTFQEPVDFNPGSGYLDMDSSDVDSDGDLDIITSSEEGEIRVFYNNDNNFFQDEVAFDIGFGTIWFETRDLNNDGFGDFAITGFNSDRTQVVLNNGDGSYTEMPTLVNSGRGRFAGNLSIVDLNGDMSPDILFVGQTANTLNVHMGLGNGEFETGVTDFNEFSPVNGYSNMEAGDVNNDGFIDLVGANSGQLGVLIADSQGEYEVFDLDPSGVGELTLSDLNNDGNLDVVTQRSFDDSIRTYLGNGEGKFAGGDTVYSGGDGHFAIGDFDGDLIPDLMTSTDGNNEGVVLSIGLGDGNFGPAVTRLVSGADDDTAIATGDLNNDGFFDAILATEENVYIFQGNASGNLSVGQEVDTGSGEKNLVVIDLNNDSALDIALVAKSPFSPASLQIFVNDGTGQLSFQSGFTIDTGISNATPTLHAADIDNDNDVDLVMNRPGWLRVLYGSGNGSFYLSNQEYGIGGFSTRKIRSADLDGDSKTELIYEDFPFRVLQHKSCFLPGDVNQDSVIDLLDVFPFVQLLVDLEFQAEADINGDGIVDLLDVEPFVNLLVSN